MTELDMDALAAQEEERKWLDEFGQGLMTELQEAIKWRAQYEERCLDAEKQVLSGQVDLGKAKGTKDAGGAMNPEVRLHERATDNQTAPQWRKIKARISNMLFGTDEVQADIEPSPKATATSFSAQPTPDAPLSKIADDAAESMEQTIKDYLAEADFARHGRAVIDDGTKVGIGVLYGPYPKLVTEKIGKTTTLGSTAVMEFDIITKTVPSVERLDWRRFYPKPCRTMEECEGVFVLDLMTKKRLEKLKLDPKCNAEQICRILEGKANTDSLLNTPLLSTNGEMSPTIKGKYPVWKYVGTIPSKCVSVLYGSEDKKEQDIDGEVMFCNGITFKADPRDGEERLPFHTYSYITDPDSVFGYGVAHEVKDDQHDINLAWASMKLNARATAMPIIAWNKALLDPDQGVVEYPFQRPIDFEHDDITKAIQVMTVPSTIGDITLIYDRAKNNLIEHSMVQSVEQEAPARADVGAAMFAMLKIEQNVVTANAAITWDDCITKPLFQAFIDFELFHGDNPANKGAFDVVPKAASHLLTKDIQQQQALQLAILADNPANAAYFKRYNLVKIVVGKSNLPVDQVMNTEEEANQIAQQQAQQPNPEIVKIEKQAETERYKADIDLKIAQIKAETDLVVGEMALEAASIKAASDEVMTQAEQDSRERIEALSIRAKALAEQLKDSREREKTASHTALEAEKLASKEMGDMLEVKVEKTPRLA
jgi:hypothetical protein